MYRQETVSFEESNPKKFFDFSPPPPHLNADPFRGYSQKSPISPSEWRLIDFRKFATIGHGNFTQVFLVQNQHDNCFYAMKVVPKYETIKFKQVRHVISEKTILSQLEHPFLVKLFQTFQDETNLYMILEFVHGGELFSHLRSVGKFPNDVAKFFAAEVILALEYLHSKDILYRDIKPENILLSSEGHVKLVDFGFAKVVRDRTWSICGTPDYLAPEIIQGKGHGKAADWWSLGVLIFEMIVGYPPFFVSGGTYNTYQRILSGKIEFPVFADARARDLIKKLLVIYQMKRLGNLKGGVSDIKRHKWFDGVNWKDLINKKLYPPIPIFVEGDGDFKYFSNLSNPTKRPRNVKLTEKEQVLFSGF